MLSNRIDLTANRDFGHRQTIVEMDMGIFDRWYDDDSITLDEYDYLSWWEGVFGKTRHTNEKRKLFGEDRNNIVLRLEMGTHCARCGKELKLPWARFYGLCRECNDDVERGAQRLPWKAYKAEVSDRRMDNASEVFSLR
jgi:hypothetical protein